VRRRYGSCVTLVVWVEYVIFFVYNRVAVCSWGLSKGTPQTFWFATHNLAGVRYFKNSQRHRVREVTCLVARRGVLRGLLLVLVCLDCVGGLDVDNMTYEQLLQVWVCACTCVARRHAVACRSWMMHTTASVCLPHPGHQPCRTIPT
jgi:hypothetical protein